MLNTQKELTQAIHRMEEATARDRAKERKQRTRRLIQKGAVLEKIFPQVKSITPEETERFLIKKKQNID